MELYNFDVMVYGFDNEIIDEVIITACSKAEMWEIFDVYYYEPYEYLYAEISDWWFV